MEALFQKSWAGGVSDMYITENSHLLEKILHGHTILADRGFDVPLIFPSINGNGRF